MFLILSWGWTESLCQRLFDKKRPISEISVVPHLSSCWPIHRTPITVAKKVKATARMSRIEIRKQNTSSNKILPFPWLLPDCFFKKLIQYTELCISRSSWYVWELSWIRIQEDANIKPCQFLPIVISNSVQRIPINQHSFFIQCWKYMYKRASGLQPAKVKVPSRRSCGGKVSGQVSRQISWHGGLRQQAHHTRTDVQHLCCLGEPWGAGGPLSEELVWFCHWGKWTARSSAKT